MIACFECNLSSSRTHTRQMCDADCKQAEKCVNIQFSREIETVLCHLGNAAHLYFFVIVCRLLGVMITPRMSKMFSVKCFGNNFLFVDSLYSEYFLRSLVVPVKNLIIATIC